MKEELTKANQLIGIFQETFNKQQTQDITLPLYTGVDLGTAYIVLAVVDSNGKPVAGAMRYAQVVKDGLVVDYFGAVEILRNLKQEIEEKIKLELQYAGVAVPPGTGEGDSRAIQYVAQAAGFEVISVIDEPTAANAVMGVRNGVVVDVGGGTTGLAVIEDNRVSYIADEPTGGTHFTLTIAGARKIPFAEAEELKKKNEYYDELRPILKPVMEKVATIIQSHITSFVIDDIFLVGGTCCYPGIEDIVAQVTGKKVIKPVNPLLVTPLGIALSSLEKGGDKGD